MTPSTSQTSIAGSMTEISKSIERESTEKREDVKHIVEKFKIKQESNLAEKSEQTLVHKPLEGMLSSPSTPINNEILEELREKVKDLESKLDTLRIRMSSGTRKSSKTTNGFEYNAINCKRIRDK